MLIIFIFLMSRTLTKIPTNLPLNEIIKVNKSFDDVKLKSFPILHFRVLKNNKNTNCIFTNAILLSIS